MGRLPALYSNFEINLAIQLLLASQQGRFIRSIVFKRSRLECPFSVFLECASNQAAGPHLVVVWVGKLYTRPDELFLQAMASSHTRFQNGFFRQTMLQQTGWLTMPSTCVSE
jgi:hypothetical protein